MKQTTRTLLMLVALAAIGGGVALYAYYGVHEKDRREDEKKDHDDRLFSPARLGEKSKDGGIASVEFTALTITASGQVTALAHPAGEGWRIVNPVHASADKLVLDSILSQLQQAKFKSVIEEKPDAAALARYGLDKPTFTLEAQAEVGDNHEKRSVKLVGGIENTYDGTVFMQRDDQPTVYAAEGGARYAFQKSTFDLREKEVFPYTIDQLTKIEVKTANNHYRLEKDDKKEWQLREPTKEGADLLTLTAMIAGLKNTHATAFPPDEADKHALRGLEPPQLLAKFELTDGGSLSYRAGKAPPDAGDPSIYALIDGPDGPVLATLAKPPEIDRNPGDLRDRTVLHFKKDQVAKIVFHAAATGDGGTKPDIVVERAARPDGGLEDSWNVTAPRAGKAKTFKISAMLWTLGSLKWEKSAEEKPKDWGKYGIDSRSRSVALFGADGKEITRFTWGKEVEGTPLFYVRGTRDQALEANVERLTELPNDAVEVIEVPPAITPAADAGK